MLAAPPFGASGNIALWRAKIKPPVELVVGDWAIAKELIKRWMMVQREMRLVIKLIRAEMIVLAIEQLIMIILSIIMPLLI